VRTSTRAPFGVVVAVTACGTLGMHLIIPALPATAQALRVSAPVIQLTITLYLIGLAAGQVLYGPVSDRFGRRPALIGGLGLFTLAGVATAVAPGAGLLIGARIVQSLGGCAGLVLGRAIVRDLAPPNQAAAQLALLTLVMSMAPAIAPAIGGYTTALAGWRAGFALLAAIGAVATGLAILFMPETNPSTGRGRSILGPSLRLLRSPAFCGYAIGGACTTTSFYAFMAASPFILMNRLHQSEERVGLYYMLLMLGVATGGLLANRLAGRLPLSTVLRLANFIGVVSASVFMAATLTERLSVLSVIGSITAFLIGAGLASPFAITGAVSVNPKAIGAASGLYGFVQMSYGALCTVAVETWRPGSVLTVAWVLLGSALVGQAALAVAVRHAGAR
jgi:DHA1 family bicyclomycin/chloramphenicol resistance-like MFS transporter